ncbi:50S ribosomal protein L11 methyltransferase [Vaginisenegalia massiliensis]|uniref:50S ribosomal protein L11 methyltransferase n=1 Tax=Vaginisenegalia massiliensis TaxID=2058294 RepID=UPI000F5413C6|nr:50S ribosomal protein L11 methyltransferase [Vaginisenegalia massiliensis]
MTKKQNWQKVLVTTTTIDPNEIDLMSQQLFSHGAIGLEVDYAQGYLENNPNLFGEIADPLPKERLEHDTEIIAYYETPIELDQLKEELQVLVPQVHFSLTHENVEDENWQQSWMVNYKPEAISRFITIVPVWEDYRNRPDEKVVKIDPGLAFGTGNHPTTQLGVQALETTMRGHEHVLDVGTGSGILSFVAGALGADFVAGYDLDPQAVDSALQNLAYQDQNGQTQYEFAVNDLLKGVDHKADIIVANILPHILVGLFDDAKRLLNHQGFLILGGILKEKGSFIEDCLQEYGWEVIQKNERKGWLGYIAQIKE